MIDAPGPVWGSGPTDATMVMLGEWPWDKGEADADEPFVGAAGRILGVACHAAGVAREECYKTFAVKCLPPSGKKGPVADAKTIRHCRQAWLNKELEELGCLRVVVAVGAGAFEGVTGERLDVHEWRGAVLGDA